MSTTFHDGYSQVSRSTVTVHEATRSAKVTYANDKGETFRVMVHQKPNSIGFHAKLPGDKMKLDPITDAFLNGDGQPWKGGILG
jgi:hypothetical protein